LEAILHFSKLKEVSHPVVLFADGVDVSFCCAVEFVFGGYCCPYVFISIIIPPIDSIIDVPTKIKISFASIIETSS